MPEPGSPEAGKKVSRRKLAQIFTAATVAAQVTLGQAPPAPAKPNKDQDLEQAKAGLRSNAAQVSRIALPMAIEPAFRFKA